MNGTACVIIAGEGGRSALLDGVVIPSVLSQGFDEVVVVGTHHAGDGYRYLPVEGLTHTTTDALVKRDVGTAATTSDVLVYLCDDHALHPDFYAALCLADSDWHVLVPQRFAKHPERGLIRIPNGEEGGYCAGHCGAFRREVIQCRPWSTLPHHRNWDLLGSQIQQSYGYVFRGGDGIPDRLAILDLEPERCPWQ